MSSASREWRWFLAWSIPGALAGFALLSVTSIGLLLALIAVVAVVLVARRAPRRRDRLGPFFVAAAALAAVAVATHAWALRRAPGRAPG